MNNSQTTLKEKYKLYSGNSANGNCELFAGELRPLSCTCPACVHLTASLRWKCPIFKMWLKMWTHTHHCTAVYADHWNIMWQVKVGRQKVAEDTLCCKFSSRSHMNPKKANEQEGLQGSCLFIWLHLIKKSGHYDPKHNISKYLFEHTRPVWNLQVPLRTDLSENKVFLLIFDAVSCSCGPVRGRLRPNPPTGFSRKQF